MKTKLFAAAVAALTLAGAAIPAAAQNYERRGNLGGEVQRDYRGDRGDWRRNASITIQKDGRTIRVNRDDRLFYRLLDRPFHFRPGMTYRYTDRCNRNGCVAFVFDGRSRRPVDRIFAPHLRHGQYAWRESAGWDRDYNRFGRYDRDDRRWNNDDERSYRDGRNGRDDDDRRDRDDDRLEGGPRRN